MRGREERRVEIEGTVRRKGGKEKEVEKRDRRVWLRWSKGGRKSL